MTSRTGSPSDHDAEHQPERKWQEAVRFSSEEEASLLEESNSLKTNANSLFSKTEYQDAINTYGEALSVCPNYLDYEVAVLKSNVAACYLNLQNWKEAISAATSAIERLQKLKEILEDEEKQGKVVVEEEKTDEESVSAGVTKVEKVTRSSSSRDYSSGSDKRWKNMENILTKVLLRRAKANCELGTWSSLSSAQEDYKTLSQMPNISQSDRKLVERQMTTLPARTKSAQSKEVDDLMGQLKNLGNGILKPFGLSTDNFKMQKDEKTGGYSMNFNQNL